MNKDRAALEQYWERFFHKNETNFSGWDIPDYILKSWARCRAIGVPFDVPSATSVPLRELNSRIEKKQSLIDIVTPYMIKLFEYMGELEYMVGFADEDGVVLKSLCDDRILKNFMDRAATPGKVFSERIDGTNSISAALLLDQPVLVHTAEHYNVGSHGLVCSGTPIHDPQGAVLGVLLVSCLEKDAHAFSLGMVTAVKDAIEKQITIEHYLKEQSALNQELSQALNYLSEGVVITDLSYQIAYVNDFCKEFLGLKNQQLLGQPLGQVIHIGTDLPALLSTGRAAPRQKVSIRTLAKSEDCDLTVSTYYDTTRKPSGYILQISPATGASQMMRRRAVSRASFTFDHIVGSSPALEQAKDYARVAASSDSSILILGESGTGKELFAQAIHNQSPRRSGPFVAINCGAIPKNLIESELFGYTAGAFTGAKKEGQPGKFELADGGTLFLDEIGDMPPDMQITLLRVLQEREFVPIGGKDPIRVDVRIIAATNRDLYQAIGAQQFRLDLLYRLNVFQLRLPPLRARREDIPVLANYFISKYNAKLNKGVYGIDGACLAQLMDYPWPGNIRELENVIERAVNLSLGGALTRVDPDPHPAALPMTEPNAALSAEQPGMVNKQTLVELLQYYEGNVSKTAAHLGITRKTLYARAGKYHLDPASFRV